MKVYLELPTQNRGLQRVYNALVKYKPNEIEITHDESEADLVIFHIIGRHDQVESKTIDLRARDIPYAMIQYVLKSTQKPSAVEWIDMWNNAKLVWSYYDLKQIVIDEGLRFEPFNPDNFYFAPLGADSEVFYERNMNVGTERPITITVLSQHALSEGAREASFAVQNVGGHLMHIGHNLRRKNTSYIENAEDDRLAKVYSVSKYVGGLRRIEGFELPCIEGLLCGARPILFDRPHYRKWYGDLAEYIPENSREGVIESLTELFKKEVRPVTLAEKSVVLDRFDWKRIITNFWNKLI